MVTIENYEGTADTLIFTTPPKTFDDASNSNGFDFPIPTTDYSAHFGGGGTNPKQLILTGFTNGTNKDTEYKEIAKHFSREDDKIKKLYWETDKFYLGYGSDCKKTHTAGRTNFIDYVAGFKTIINIIFGDTQKTSGTNDGNFNTVIEEITGTLSAGTDNVRISNGTDTIKINMNTTAGGEAFQYNMVKAILDTGITEFVVGYSEVAGTQISTTVADSPLMYLDEGANVSTITVKEYTGNTDNGTISSLVVKFRDGYT